MINVDFVLSFNLDAAFVRGLLRYHFLFFAHSRQFYM
jgi:hypothetical protein